jgi:lipoprotein-anchoring transpeptidase ErfK/SrfK
MATDMLMRIEGVSGESKDSNHKDWTDIESFSWAATQPGSMVSDWFGSHGCVRLAEDDAKTLYGWATIGTTVTIQ